ncbi:MAG: hypothetical protein U9Q78_09240 [Chloroflexota bacterium]|nr:hypothetical protein [Chloroflexota bacterium]
MKGIVIFGAGKVGRGFLGQLFTESGYQVTFVDVDRELVEAVNARGGYRLQLVDNEGTKELWIEPVRAIDGRDVDRAVAYLNKVELAATAVGARALPEIAPTLAQAISQRADQAIELPLNIITCENLQNADKILQAMVREKLESRYHPFLEDRVGFVKAVIGRMMPPIPSEMRQQDPALMIAEPYRGELIVSQEEILGPIPEVIGLRAERYFEAWAARKLYLHNASHAMLAYLGYLKGLTYGYEALYDPDVRPHLDRALDESLRALAMEFGFEESGLRSYAAGILRRLDNRALADTIFRLARDPMRKLGPEDRLVGPARLALKHGIAPRGLAWGIGAGLAYDDLKDPHAAELQRLLSAEGIEGVLRSVCDLDLEAQPSKQLFDLVSTRYAALKQSKFHL